MKLVTFSHGDTVRPGVLTAGGEAVLPLPYPTMQALIEAPWDQVRAAAAAGGTPIPLSQVTLLTAQLRLLAETQAVSIKNIL